MSKLITYSPAYTLVPTYECFNRCTYCNFRTDIGQSPWITLTQARKILESLQSQGICEILVLSGEIHPQSPQRKDWFERIYQLCELALSLGFLPHTNAGILSFTEMEQLKQVNVSMGLMLEQINPHLLSTVHRHAPSKVPQLRLQQLEWAGQLRIPFTTGLLLGIGETENDWWDTLNAIAQIHQRWGHIQEVILQPHSPGHQQHLDSPPFDEVEAGYGFKSRSTFDPYQIPNVIAKARELLPESIMIQIPPNLIPEPHFLLSCLNAGARDLGGISPKDEVNPDYPHPNYQSLTKILESSGWPLVPRLPVYPQYYEWLPLNLQKALKNWTKL